MDAGSCGGSSRRASGGPGSPICRMKAARTRAAVRAMVRAQPSHRRLPGGREQDAGGGLRQVGRQGEPDGQPQHALDRPPQMVGRDQRLARPRGPENRPPSDCSRRSASWCCGVRGRSAPWMSCRTCVMNSTSMPPPGTSFTSQGPCGGRSRCTRRRISSASCPQMHPAGWRGRSAVRKASSTTGWKASSAGDDAGAGERHLLPGPGLFGMVEAKGAETDRHRPLIARRPAAAYRPDTSAPRRPGPSARR